MQTYKVAAGKKSNMLSRIAFSTECIWYDATQILRGHFNLGRIGWCWCCYSRGINASLFWLPVSHLSGRRIASQSQSLRWGCCLVDLQGVLASMLSTVSWTDSLLQESRAYIGACADDVTDARECHDIVGARVMTSCLGRLFLIEPCYIMRGGGASLYSMTANWQCTMCKSCLPVYARGTIAYDGTF